MSADDTVSATAEALDPWLGEVCELLGLDRSAIASDVVLDLAREVAHGVGRPAAPLTAFLLGVAAGRAQATREELGGIAALITEHIDRRSTRP